MKCEEKEMLVKDLISFSDKGILEEYKVKASPIWTEAKKESYLLNLQCSRSTTKGFEFYLYLTKSGIYQIVDGKQRIKIILEQYRYFKGDSTKQKRIEEVKIKIILITEANKEEITNYYEEINNIKLSEPEKRLRNCLPKVKKTVDGLLKEDFFKNCQIQGNKEQCADRDCVEILAAFCNGDGFLNSDEKTLPSSLKKYVKTLSYENYINDFGQARLTLRFMHRVFANTNYVCRPIDFCYMAIIYRICYNAEFNNFVKTNNDYSLIYGEYIKFLNGLDPCIALNPLAKENLEVTIDRLTLMLSHLHGDEYEIIPIESE
jgi:hypothetical protein